MAGIYIHIPWCRQVCVYCDFHFSVSMRNRAEMLECIAKELEMQRDYPGREPLKSVYFGGGTPSLLNARELSVILSRIRLLFNISGDAEITLEANPDDLSVTYLNDLKNIGINRLSIGVQSFFDDDLRWMNRRHDSRQAIQSIVDSKKAGFNNLNIDLIYGLPDMKIEKWNKNLDLAFESGVQHLSAYHLTLEKKTVYSYRVRKGIMREPDEEPGMEHFEFLMERAEKEGFIHYEISNFAKPGFLSVHNTSCWMQRAYLGVGPSANSFNGESRQWNVSNNGKYIEKIKEGSIPCEYEKLELKDRYNEYILTSLRTMWGLDIEKIERQFGSGFAVHCMNEAAGYIKEGKLEIDGNFLKLGRKGKFFADGIISQLFRDE